MPQQPIDYATPAKPEPRRLSPAAKWALIVFALLAATVFAFVVLFTRYVMSIGPLDSR